MAERCESEALPGEQRGESGHLHDEDYRAHAEFRHVMRRFFRFSEEQARDLDVTPQQHVLVLVIRGHPSYPEVSITELAESLQIKHHSASLLVERAVKRGLVSRRQDTVDRRRALVSLSPAGQHILERITQANRVKLRELDEALIALQRSINRSLDAGDAGADGDAPVRA